MWIYVHCWGLLSTVVFGKSLNGKLQVWFQKQMACLSSYYKISCDSTWMGCSIMAVWILASWPLFVLAVQNIHHIASWLWADVFIYFRSCQQFERETMLFFAFQSWFLGAFKYCSFPFSESGSGPEGATAPGQWVIRRAVHIRVLDFTLSPFWMVSIETEPTNSGNVRWK